MIEKGDQLVFIQLYSSFILWCAGVSFYLYVLSFLKSAGAVYFVQFYTVSGKETKMFFVISYSLNISVSNLFTAQQRHLTVYCTKLL